MTKFKVVAIPQVELSGVKGSEFYSLKTATLLYHQSQMQFKKKQ